MKYEAREYKYLDGSSIQLEAKEVVKRDEIKGYLFNINKYEGKIYERENVLSREDLINENDDIKMMHHAGKFDGFNGRNGKSIEVIERKAKALEDINVDNVKSVEVDECISNGKWNGELLSQERYDDLMRFINKNHIEMVEEYELENKSIFKIRKFKGDLVKVYGVKKSSLIEKESMNADESFKGISCGKMEKSYRKVYVLNDKDMEDDKEEIDRWEKRYIRSEIEGGLVEVMSAVEEIKEVNKFRYDRNDWVEEDMKGIMKNSKYDENISANINHSLFELKAINNKYINSNGKYSKEGEIFSINYSHDNMRSGREDARIRMKEINNNLNKNNGGKYWSAILNKWVSY